MRPPKIVSWYGIPKEPTTSEESNAAQKFVKEKMIEAVNHFEKLFPEEDTVIYTPPEFQFMAREVAQENSHNAKQVMYCVVRTMAWIWFVGPKTLMEETPRG